MARAVFEQGIFIAAPCEVVQKHLAKLMTNIAEVHPQVLWARHTQTNTASDGTQIDYYLVRDKMKLGLFPIEFTYKVDMSVPAPGKLISNAYQVPGIHLYNETWCEVQGEGTRVCERIDITAPRLLMKATYEGAATAHTRLLANLKTRIEQEHVQSPSQNLAEEKWLGGEFQAW